MPLMDVAQEIGGGLVLFLYSATDLSCDVALS